MGSCALAVRSWTTVVITLGVPQVCGVVYGDPLEVEVLDSLQDLAGEAS